LSINQGHEINTIFISGYHVAAEVVFYEVVVSNKKLRWNLWIRYASFAHLHELLKDLVDGLRGKKLDVILPPFPKKQPKAFVDHFSV